MEAEVETFFLGALILSLLIVFGVDVAQKRRRFLAEQDR